MNTYISYGTGICLLTLICLGTTPVRSAPPEKQAVTPARSSDTNGVPQSVFTIPSNTNQGRDPFFPDATYWLHSSTVVTTTTRPQVDVALVLNGLSGSVDHKLAIINGKTLEEGETADVPTSSGRVRVRCVEIDTDTTSVIVEVGGERKVLRLGD